MKRPPRGSYGPPPTVVDTLGTRIRRVRLAWNWSQTQLAEAIHSNQKTLSHWERDRQVPSEAALGALAQLLGLSAESLRTGKGFKIPDPPKRVGSLLVPDRVAANLVNLPRVGETGITLMHREDESQSSATPRQIAHAIRKAKEEDRPIWVIIG